MSIQALPYIVLLGFLFGSTLVASRFSVGQFQPSTYIGLRLMLASMGHVTIYTLARGRHWPTSRRLWFHAAMLGIFGTAVPMTSIVSSLQYQSAGVTSLLITTNPAITVLLAHFFLPDERLNRRKSAGIILALGGAMLLTLRGESGLPDVSRASPLGYGLVLMAMLFGSGMTIYTRKYMSDLDSFDVASIRMFVAALIVMPLSALIVGFDLGAVTGTGYLALLYAALVGTFSGLMLAFYNIKRFGATAGALAAYVIPLVASIGGLLFLGETFTPFMLVGLALITLGITLLNK
ncbi:MAG: DMT family transporter [Anaerolineae bacterium]